MSIYNIYCDESCHLLGDDSRYMVLGGMICPLSDKRLVFSRIKEIKKEHGIHSAEMKWSKVSKAKLQAYKDLVNYFFDIDFLRFRAYVVDKDTLNYEKYTHSHDEFYYKIYFRLLEWFVSPSNEYRVFLDIKDTLGTAKIAKLKNVICNSKQDYSETLLKTIQEVRSHEIALMQAVDILIGAISYANRYPDGGGSEAKNELVKLIKSRSGCSLTKSTMLGAHKFNIFHWEGN